MRCDSVFSPELFLCCLAENLVWSVKDWEKKQTKGRREERMNEAT
jgi:hypothetical protein